MGPYYSPNRWFVIAPKLNQKHFVCWAEERRLLTCLDIFDAWQKLARPEYESKNTQIQRISLDSHVTSEPSLNTIPNSIRTVPNELLFQICSYLPRKDVVSLGTTCTTLANYVASYIEDDIRSVAAPWAGQPLAMGRQCWNTLPDGYIDLINEQNQKMAEISLQWYRDAKPQNGALMNDIWAVPEPPEDRLRTWAVLLQNSCETYDLNPTAVTLMREAILKPGLKDNPVTPCYLRNLTKKELIRCQSNPRSFGGLVLTGQSSIPSIPVDTLLCSLILCDYQSKGTWAGDCFDIVTSRIHNTENGDDSVWKHVTDASLVEIMKKATRKGQRTYRTLPGFLTDVFGSDHWLCPAPDLRTGYAMDLLGTSGGRFEIGDDQLFEVDSIQCQPTHVSIVGKQEERTDKLSNTKRFARFLKSLAKGKRKGQS